MNQRNNVYNTLRNIEINDKAARTHDTAAGMNESEKLNTCCPQSKSYDWKQNEKKAEDQFFFIRYNDS